MKRKLFLLLGACLGALGLIGLAAPMTFAATRQSAAAGPENICVGDPVPRGDVVTSIQQPLQLPTFQIQPPSLQCLGHKWPFTEHVVPAPPIGQQLKVCSNSPIPDGYVIVADSDGTSSACTAGLGGSETITLASGDSVWVCADSPIPSSYMPTGQKTFDSACDVVEFPTQTFANNAFEIAPKPIQSPLS
jgi:hypothetical protein